MRSRVSRCAVDGEAASDSIAARNPPMPARDHEERDRPEDEEERGLHRVDPRRAAHAAEEHVPHHDQRHDRAAEPVRHDPAADGLERRAAALHGDDDVGHQQRGLHDEDDRADVAALPAVAEHLDRRHEPVAPAERPQPRADRQQRHGDDSADADAMRPKVTMPFENAWPEAPRMENAVMFVPNSDSRNTAGPSERPARK